MNLGASSIATLKLGSQQASRVMLGAGEVWANMDPDAAAYFARIVAAGSTISEPNKVAVNAFVVGCKADGIWTAIKASCLLAGPDDLTGALVPLVGPVPTNFNFLEGDYNRVTGLKGDASTKYLDANRNNNVDPQNSFHQVVWKTQLETGVHAFIGAATNINGSSNIGSTFIRSRMGAAGPTGNNVLGFIGSSRSSSTGFNYRRGGTTLTQLAASDPPRNSATHVFGRSEASELRTDARLSFYSIGESLDLALLDARLATYMAALT
jgi:hypothetical protein